MRKDRGSQRRQVRLPEALGERFLRDRATEAAVALFPYEVNNGKARLIGLSELEQNQPQTTKYLRANRTVLESRERGKFKDAAWYRFGRSQNITRQESRKLCVPRLVESLHAAYDAEATHFLDNVDVNGVVWKERHRQQDLTYLLGLLNSKLLRWYFPFVSAPFRGGYLSANRQFLSQVPIRTIDFDVESDTNHHSRMVNLVESMLDLHQRHATAKTHDDRTLLERRIAATDRQINRLVYDLYDLTDEEISIVEKSVG